MVPKFFLVGKRLGFRPDCFQFTCGADCGPFVVRENAEEIAVADDFDNAGNVLDRGFVDAFEFPPSAGGRITLPYSIPSIRKF